MTVKQLMEVGCGHVIIQTVVQMPNMLVANFEIERDNQAFESIHPPQKKTEIRVG